MILLTCLFACLSLQLGISNTPTAFAATWPSGSAQGSVCLAFGEAYTFDASMYTHKGIDIAASAGESVKSPLGGTVSFVGRVPAADSLAKDGTTAKETMNAVSVKLKDGRTITLMPFEGVLVKEGQQVAEGSLVGTLAATGDRSSGAPHLHMGLKEGKRYCDPMSLFASAATSSTQMAASTAGVSRGEDAARVQEQALAPAEAGAVQEVVSDSANSQPALEAEPPFGTIASGVLAVEPLIEADGAEDAGIFSLLDVIGAACLAQLDSLLVGYEELATQVCLHVQLLVFASMVLGLALATAIAIPVINLIRRNVAHEKVRENSSLFKSRGGASIYGLFPAPGTSFITRGRLAQRR